ncbi:MAG TPA: HEAT repeat domain-containing protein [Thermoanaerobaculia bacterium]|nr:HEAT repeat domain-containing protein [Thermoanaerobaculia bacterium]
MNINSTRVTACLLALAIVLHAHGANVRCTPRSLSPSAVKSEVRRLSEVLRKGSVDARSVALYDLACLGASAEPAVPLMIESFAARNGELQGLAIDAVAAIGVPAVPHLIRALESSNVNIRGNACSALGAIGAPAKAALPALAKLAVGAPGTTGQAEIAIAKIVCRKSQR